MAKDKRKRNQARKALRQEYGLKERMEATTASHQDNGIVPANAAINQNIDELLTEHVSAANFRLIFSEYKNNCCEVHKMTQKTKVKALMHKLAQITKYSPITIAQANLYRDNVERDCEYGRLYANLPEDVSIKEMEFAETGRIFFYTYRNYFCIVAITQTHLKN